jgi:hypothetical protein
MPPVFLGREVNDVLSCANGKRGKATRLNQTQIAVPLVGGKHCGELPLELKCQTFAHNANAIDSVDNHSTIGFKDIPLN